MDLVHNHFLLGGNSTTTEPETGSVTPNAVKVMRIATGEDSDTALDDGKNKAAQELGRMGGAARAKSMSAKRRKEIAKKAAKSRWNNT